MTQTESTVKPAWYWLRKIEGSTGYVRVRWAIKEVVNAEESAAQYEYNEREVLIKLPVLELSETELSEKLSARFSLPDAKIVVARDQITLDMIITGQSAETYQELSDFILDHMKGSEGAP